MIETKKYVLPVVFFLCVAAGIVLALPSLPLRVGQQALAICAVMWFIASFLIRNVWLKLFAFWNIIRFVMFVNEPSFFTLLVTIMLLVFYETITREIKENQVTLILNAICIVSLVEIVFIILQACGIWISYVPKDFKPAEWTILLPNRFVSISMYLGKPMEFFGSISGTTGGRNFASALIGMSFPAFIRAGWWKCIPLLVLALWLTHSFNGIIPVLVVVFLYTLSFINNIKAKIAVFSVTLTVFLAYFLRFENLKDVLFSGSYRYEAWRWAFKEIIPLRWLEGWGVGQSPFLHKIYSLNKVIDHQGAWMHPHSEVVNTMVEIGTIGLLIAGLYFFFLLWESRGVIRVNYTAYLVFLGVVAGLVNSLFSFSLHLPIGLIFLTFIALLQYFNNQKMEGLR